MKTPGEDGKPDKRSAPGPGRCPDRLVSFMLAEGTIRGAFLSGTAMVRKMRESHGLGILETLVLGHALMAAGLMSTGLKGQDRLSIRVECSGPVKGLVAEADALGRTRGYLKNVPIPVEKPLESFDLRQFFGAGFLTVTKQIEGARHPYQGRVMMAYGSLAKDLAYYFLTSEQIPTAFNLSVKFDPRAEVEGAGGLLLQAMPGASREVVEELEKMVVEMPSPGQTVAESRDSEQIVVETFQSLGPKIISKRQISFACHCSKDKVRVMLAMVGADELMDMAKNGPFPVVVRCHFCNAAYSFSQQELQQMLNVHFSDN